VTAAGDFLLVAVCALGAVTALMVATTLWAKAVDRVSVVDVSWGVGFVLVAVVAALVGGSTDADARRWVVLALVAVWGGRLAWHLGRRAVGHGEDPRYAALLGGTPSEIGIGPAIRKVFVVQGIAMWFVSLPVIMAGSQPTRWWPIVAVGTLVWLVGLVFETVGDAQLAAYKKLPKDQRPPVLQTGLWRYTRHPNYFGDACVAWGLWLVGGVASGWVPALVTVLAPVAMTYFLVLATGARLLEQTMMQRPGYAEYAARTSMFVPLPPGAAERHSGTASPPASRT
jgi:steroid 5-alpha reductase family enzyme